MWQSLLINLIVGVAALYVIWTLMPSRLRARLRVRLHLASGQSEGSGAAAPGGASGELPCDNCAHNGAPHVRSHR
jgi:hypothetical protein